MAQAEMVIYEPPHPGLPYLVVTLTPTGVNVVPVKSNTEARVMISQGRERRHTSDRQKPSPVTSVAAAIWAGFNPAVARWLRRSNRELSGARLGRVETVMFCSGV